MSIQTLPTEIVQLIYLYAQSSHLQNVCKSFKQISQDTVTITKSLLVKHLIWFPDDTIKREVANDQWLHFVKDNEFNTNVALTLFNLNYTDPNLIEIIAEYSASHGVSDLMEWMIHHAPFKPKGLSQLYKDRCLIQAAMFGHLKNVQLLLLANANPKYDSDAALCMSSKYGHIDCVKMLLKYDTNIHVDDDYPLCWSSRHGFYDMVELLIDAGANVNARRGCALHWAAEHGHIEIVRLLLDSGTNIHSNDDHALRWSAVHGHANIVKLLLSRGADIHANDDYALRNATKMQRFDVLKFLVEAGANIHACNDEAIKWSIQHKDLQALQILVPGYEFTDLVASLESISLST
ncbi:hypothetical protein HDV02_005159 [Globomyces sp. JEL0801]|nr:hypothetical protein HDV02_005159 [Globomyces sp. JEL0801]